MILPAMLAVVAGASLASPQPTVSAPTVQLGPADMLRLADKAKREGKPELSETLYRAMLADRHVEVRSEAAFQLALLLVSKGEKREAARLLRLVLDEQPEALNARIAMAQLLVSLGDERSARRELRAAQAGRPPLALARQIDRFSAILLDRRRLGGEVAFTIAPDSNINRATASDRLNTVLGDFTIDEGGRVRSGIGATIDASAFVRQPLTDQLLIIGQVAARATRYRKSEFNRTLLQGRIGAQFRVGSRRLSLALTQQRQIFGAKMGLTSVGIEADASSPLSRTAQLRLSAGAARVTNHYNFFESGTALAASGALDLALSPRTAISILLTGGRRTARDAAFANRSFEIGLTGSRDIGRLTLGTSLALGQLRADDRLILLPERRRDRNVAATLSLTSRSLQFHGLAPGLRLSIERNHSNIAFYETRRRALEFTFTRAF